MRTPLNTAALLALGLSATAACSEAPTPAPAPAPGARFAVAVAPLDLPGLTDVCYALTVFGGANPATAPTVWQKTHLCSTRYGDGSGALSYVGTCDASDGGSSVVRLVLEDLCTGGPCADVTPGATSIPAASWDNPCPAPDGCVRPATCRQDADTPVTFDLTVARAAQQGFFDVAVTFSDLFCSAKLDCQNDQNGPLELLHDPADGRRKQSIVLAWACTAGPGATTTHLYFDNVLLRCFDTGGALLGEWAYDPSVGPGNAGPGAAPFVFQTATYRTVTQQSGILGWSMAFGIREAALPGRCTLTARATASDSALPAQTTPQGAVYPFVTWDVELSASAGDLTCTQHEINVPGSGVATDYVRTGARTFTHVLFGAAPSIASLGRQACTGVIPSLTDGASFGVQAEGLTARVGTAQSPFYQLPAGLSLQGCCGDPCCGPAGP